MPTVFTHPALPLAVGLGLGRATISSRLLLAGVAASILPDLDVVSLRLGVSYSSAFGHRGLTHSFAFALSVALVGAICHRWLHARSSSAFLFLLAATASHGVLDAFTNGGLGIAFLWPFSSERYFALSSHRGLAAEHFPIALGPGSVGLVVGGSVGLGSLPFPQRSAGRWATDLWSESSKLRQT